MISHRDWGYSCAFGDDFNQAPALGLGQRPGFLDPHTVADFGLGLLIVGVEFLIAGNDFFELWMRKTPLDAHNNSFGHLVGDDFAKALLAIASGAGCRTGGGGCRWCACCGKSCAG